jgi:Pyridoxamine 5'-phosphate oxidase
VEETYLNMGKVLPDITTKEEKFIASQKVFFVATAPLSKDHHVSVSPKANDGTLIVIDKLTVAYADYTGSGAETAAHILQNRRMTLMFCNIEKGLPNILRLFGHAELLLPENAPLSLLQKFPKSVTESFGFRAIYIMHIRRISSSCGYSLPIMEFSKFRSTLHEYNEREGKVGMFNYMTLKNSFSIDGLPSVALLRKDAPPNIGPVYDSGYIFGKEVTQENQTGAKERFQFPYYEPSMWSKQIYTRTRDLLIVATIIFVAGIVVGIFSARYGEHLFI